VRTGLSVKGMSKNRGPSRGRYRGKFMGQVEKRKDSELSIIMSYMTHEIVKNLKLRRTRWPGYLARANETSQCRKVTFLAQRHKRGLEDPA
jgi:hypothetical protein